MQATGLTCNSWTYDRDVRTTQMLSRALSPSHCLAPSLLSERKKSKTQSRWCGVVHDTYGKCGWLMWVLWLISSLRGRGRAKNVAYCRFYYNPRYPSGVDGDVYRCWVVEFDARIAGKMSVGFKRVFARKIRTDWRCQDNVVGTSCRAEEDKCSYGGLPSSRDGNTRPKPELRDFPRFRDNVFKTTTKKTKIKSSAFIGSFPEKEKYWRRVGTDVSSKCVFLGGLWSDRPPLNLHCYINVNTLWYFADSNNLSSKALHYYFHYEIKIR